MFGAEEMYQAFDTQVFYICSQCVFRTKCATKRNWEKKKKDPVKEAEQKENCESTQENRTY